jgi:hypothetical protein
MDYDILDFMKEIWYSKYTKRGRGNYAFTTAPGLKFWKRRDPKAQPCETESYNVFIAYNQASLHAAFSSSFPLRRKENGAHMTRKAFH